MTNELGTLFQQIKTKSDTVYFLELYLNGDRVEADLTRAEALAVKLELQRLLRKIGTLLGD